MEDVGLIPTAWVPVIALLSRCFGCAIVVPFGDSISTIPKLILAVGLACALLTSVDTGTFASGIGVCSLLAILVAEFIAGILLTTPMRILVEASEMFGELLDTTRGQTIGSVQDPLNGQMTSDLASIMRIATLVVVLQLGGLEALTLTLARSIEVLPIGFQVGSPSLASNTTNMAGSIDIVVSILRLAMIWVFGFISVDIVCAAMSRLVSGFSFAVLGSLCKTSLTFLLLLALFHTAVTAPPEWVQTILSTGLKR